MRSPRTLVAATCAAYAVYCVATLPPGPITAPDSAGYLTFSPIHVLGYPIFLRIVGARGAMIVQPLVFAASLTALGFEALRLTSTLPFALAVVVAPMATPGLTGYHASILTESLFTSGLVGFLAAAAAFARAPSVGRAALAGVLAGLTATVRRTGVALLPVVAIMVWLAWRRNARPRAALAAGLAAALAIVGGERLSARSVHGNRIATEAGRHLYAKAALVDAPISDRSAADPLRAALDDHLAALYQPVRDLIRGAPDDVAGVLTVFYETCLQGPCVPELGTAVTGSEGARMNAALFDAGAARIARAPLQFMRLTARDYRSLWLVKRTRHPDTAPALHAFIAAHRPLPFERDARLSPDLLPPLEPQPVVRAAQWLVTAVAWLTALLAGIGLVAMLARRTLDPCLAIACVAAIAAHGSLLFTALLATGLSRLTIGVWPAVTTAALFGAWCSTRSVFHR